MGFHFSFRKEILETKIEYFLLVKPLVVERGKLTSPPEKFRVKENTQRIELKCPCFLSSKSYAWPLMAQV